MFKTPSKNKAQQHQPAHYQKETPQNKNEPATRGTQPSFKGTPTIRLHNLASNHAKCCPTKGQRNTHILTKSYMTLPWPPEVENAPLPSLARQGEPSFNQINKFICHENMRQCHTKGGKPHADKPDTPKPPRPCLSNILPEPTPDQNRPPTDPSQPPIPAALNYMPTNSDKTRGQQFRKLRCSTRSGSCNKSCPTGVPMKSTQQAQRN